MNISIEQYRASIGLHNRYRVKDQKYSQANQLECSFWLDSLGTYFNSIGIQNWVFVILLLNYVFDILNECISSNYFSAFNYHTNTFVHGHMNLTYEHWRILLSCIFYSLFSFMRYPNCPRNVTHRPRLRKILKRNCVGYVYSLWIVSFNLIMIGMTIPNISNPGPLNDLKVLYHNVNGFINLRDKSPCPSFYTSKLNDFHGHIFTEKPDVIILNETWLKSSILDSEIFPNNSYKVFRRDRSNLSHPSDPENQKKFRKLGGGVLIAFRSDLDVKTTVHKIKTGGSARAEILSAVLKSGSGRGVCFSTLYRVGTLGAENLKEVERHLKSIISTKSLSKHILVGDFNLNKSSWPTGTSTCNIEKGFLDMFHDFNFDQLISKPTHKAGKTLDLLFCNDPTCISDIEVLSPGSVCNSDHCGISFKVKLNCKRLKGAKRKIYNLKNADFKGLDRELKYFPWDHILYDNDIDTSLKKFESIFLSACDRFIPKITIKSSFQPPWFDSELDSLCKTKNKLLDKKKGTVDEAAKSLINEKIKKVRKKFRKLSTKKKMDNILNDDDPALVKKKFWSFFKATSNSCRIPETVNYGNKFRSKDSDVADLFNKFFSDQFSSPSNYDIAVDFSDDPFTETTFDENKIFDLLRKMNANKAAGPDGIQSKIMKSCARGLSKPLSILFNRIFQSGKIPSTWKMANVVPIFKKGDKTSVSNYRPISLTSLPMKILEYCIKDLLMQRCEHLIKDNQHGFRSNKSCLTQLLPYVDKLSEALNNQSRIDTIYFDFAKAFDSVNHDLILYKLKNVFRVDGLLLQFIKDYLRDRKQQVVINNSSSGPLPVHSGVPQGSILGPLFFVLFIDDICDVVDDGTDIALYADDTKMWREILSEKDQAILQNDINNLFEWSIKNKMNFHPDKCKVVSITNKPLEHPLPFYEYWYSMNGILLDYVKYEKDLGVIINSKLSWSSHCDTLVNKANIQLALVRRSCYFILDSIQRRILYLALVRSLFEHCCQVWAPQNKKCLGPFELLQKRAIKWILKEQQMSYSDSDLLEKQYKLDLLPMKEKFVFSDLVLFYKIINDEVPISLPNYVSRMKPQHIKHVTRSTRAIAEGADKSKFSCNITTKIKAFQDSYYNRTVHAWNALPVAIRESVDVSNFKIALKEHLWLLLGLKPD